MMVLCYVIIFFLFIVLITTVFNAFSAPMLKNGPIPKNQPLVSVLIPVRNEAQNIEGCLKSLLKQDYPNFEILVLDDGSSDDTVEIIHKVKEDKRIQYLEGKELPKGWTGKNYACHQLSKQANGDILIFTDADNRYTETAISKTIGWMQKLELDLFSTFPQQLTLTLGEKLVVPSVYMTVYCYLPLWLTYILPSPSLAAANGQWIAFKNDSYQKLGGHEKAKNQIVEDTWLTRHAKTLKMKTITAAGTGEVFGRMYKNWDEVWQGFSKNLFGLMNYKLVAFIFLLLFMFISYVAPYFLIVFPSIVVCAGISIIINIVIRLILTVKYKDPIITVLLHPLAIILTILIGINSIRIFNSPNLKWKGRTIFINENENI